MRKLSGALAVAASAALIAAGCAGPGENGNASSPAGDDHSTSTGPSTLAEPEGPDVEDDPDSEAVMPGTLVVTRTGGFAGTVDTVEVEPDGSWTVETENTGSSSGSAPASAPDSELASQLAELLNDPGLAETGDVESKGECADMYTFAVTVDYADERGTLELRSDECGEAPNEVFAAVVSLVTEHTDFGD